MLANYKKEFTELKEKVKEDESNYDEREFYTIIEQIDFDIEDLSERVFNHPKYNFRPTKDVPESIELYSLEKLKIKILAFITMRNSFPFDPEKELDIMFPNRHDEDFDEDSMNYDSIFGKD